MSDHTLRRRSFPIRTHCFCVNYKFKLKKKSLGRRETTKFMTWESYFFGDSRVLDTHQTGVSDAITDRSRHGWEMLSKDCIKKRSRTDIISIKSENANSSSGYGACWRKSDCVKCSRKYKWAEWNFTHRHFQMSQHTQQRKIIRETVELENSWCKLQSVLFCCSSLISIADDLARGSCVRSSRLGLSHSSFSSLPHCPSGCSLGWITLFSLIWERVERVTRGNNSCD